MVGHLGAYTVVIHAEGSFYCEMKFFVRVRAVLL